MDISNNVHLHVFLVLKCSSEFFCWNTFFCIILMTVRKFQEFFGAEKNTSSTKGSEDLFCPQFTDSLQMFTWLPTVFLPSRQSSWRTTIYWFSFQSLLYITLVSYVSVSLMISEDLLVIGSIPCFLLFSVVVFTR